MRPRSGARAAAHGWPPAGRSRRGGLAVDPRRAFRGARPPGVRGGTSGPDRRAEPLERADVGARSRAPAPTAAASSLESSCTSRKAGPPEMPAYRPTARTPVPRSAGASASPVAHVSRSPRRDAGTSAQRIATARPFRRAVTASRSRRRPARASPRRAARAGGRCSAGRDCLRPPCPGQGKVDGPRANGQPPRRDLVEGLVERLVAEERAGGSTRRRGYLPEQSGEHLQQGQRGEVRGRPVRDAGLALGAVARVVGDPVVHHVQRHALEAEARLALRQAEMDDGDRLEFPSSTDVRRAASRW